MSEVQSDHDLLLELKGDVKTLVKDVAEIKNDTKTTIDDHEKRIKSLEISRAQGNGAERVITTLISLAAAGAVTWLVKLLTRHP